MVVPHYFQSSEQTCGAACLRMLFAALGIAHDETIIAQHCGVTPLGCTVQDLVAGAHSLGFNAAMLPVTGEPAAIAALSNETFHDPADGPDRHVKLDDFLAAWATAGYRGVRVWTP